MIADLADFFAVVAPPSASLGSVAAQIRPEAEPAPILRLRPLRPPLPFLRRRGASILPAGDRQSGSRCAPFLRRSSLPCGQPASASHRLPVRAAAHAPSLRRFSFPSVSAELISGRFPSSPLRASNHSGGQGRAVRSPGIGTDPLRLCPSGDSASASHRLHVKGSWPVSSVHRSSSLSAPAELVSGRTSSGPSPSPFWPQPTFALCRSDLSVPGSAPPRIHLRLVPYLR